MRPDVTATAADPRSALIAEIAACTHDPLRFVMRMFPWGEPGQLAHHNGPRVWQAKVLRRIGERLRAGASAQEAIRMAVASGHGIGKSALVSWVILWALATKPHARGVVTANTDTQLRTKTWPEVSKWAALALFQRVGDPWFTVTATAVYSTEAEKTWRVDAVPWSNNNTEAFAGLHNEGSRVLLIFDEASAISDKIWEVSEGALTDANTEILWMVFGNPTKNAGRFRECFGRLAHRWEHEQIDSRTVEGTNRAQLNEWVQDYGEDSDFVRVRVRGVFPRAGSMQFIPSDVVERATRCEVVATLQDAVILGVDVARFGDDESVICMRRGRDARNWTWEKHRGLDTMQLAHRVGAVITRERPDAVFVDETGVGAGVVDKLRELGHKVIGVNNGASADHVTVDAEACANKGAECWAAMRTWLKTGGAIPDDPDLRAQLEGREFGYNVHGAIVLERKDDMKKRGLASPDRADALALTFAYPVGARKPDRDRPSGQPKRYDPLRRIGR